MEKIYGNVVGSTGVANNVDGSITTEKIKDGAVTPEKLDRSYLTEHQSLEEYAKKDYVNAKVSEIVASSGQVQSDYAENDITSPSYIVNREFYRETIYGGLLTVPEYTGKEVCTNEFASIILPDEIAIQSLFIVKHIIKKLVVVHQLVWFKNNLVNLM